MNQLTVAYIIQVIVCQPV